MVFTDEEIKKRVVDELYWDDRIDASKVMVEVENQKVTLTGTVPSSTHRRRAEEDTRQVQDVVNVDDKLTVEYPSGAELPSDDDIEESVEHRIHLDPNLTDEDIHASVSKGLVVLEGSVDAYWKKTLATRVADKALGVIDIENRLTVSPTEKVEDSVIADDVRSAIERNANVNVEDVDVTVESGVVTLSGTVPTWNACRYAVDAAELTRGVVEVKNNLTIASRSEAATAS
ncbi:MAG TPA: BON domain-containing protein [Methanomicrobiales archaeon]|nr:BON domain-containing protein [Methanomicrobiales archaeon]